MLRPTDRLNRCLAVAQALSDEQPHVRLAAYIDLRREASFDDATESRIGLDRRQFEAASQQLVEQKAASARQGRNRGMSPPSDFKSSSSRWSDAASGRTGPSKTCTPGPRLGCLVGHESTRQPRRLGRRAWRLIAHGELVRRGDRVGLPTAAELSHRQRQLLDVLLAECVDAGRDASDLEGIRGSQRLCAERPGAAGAGGGRRGTLGPPVARAGHRPAKRWRACGRILPTIFNFIRRLRSVKSASNGE